MAGWQQPGFLYKHDLNGNPAGIINISAEISNSFSLSQNYPNPFNPVTNIKFSIPGSGNVKPVVYNALGRETITLANGRYSAETYNADLDASMLVSGVYFYRIELSDPSSGSGLVFTDVKKIILIK